MKPMMERRTGKSGGSRAGSTLLAVITLVGTMMVLSLIFLRVGQQVSNEQLATVNGMRAGFLAEAGISEALEAVRSGQSGAIGSQKAPAYLGGGVVWVEATDLGDGRTQLDSMAMKDGGRSALRVVVGDGDGGDEDDGDAGVTSAFYTMLFSNKTLDLKQDVVIDSWDSELGTYASQATNTHSGTTYAGSEGGAASNAGIVLNAGVKVFGDVNSGPGFSVNTAATTHVSGSTSASLDQVPLAQIPVPVVAASGVYSVANNATKTINPGTYHYTNLTQGKFSTLKVVGPATVVLDGYTTGVSATLEIDATNGPVTIYDTGVWSVDKNYKLIPKDGTPIDGAFLISSPGTVQFDQGSLIKFGFYAPNATIQVDQGAEVWGALVADQITVNQGTKFHFDENLKGFELPWKVPGSILGLVDEGEPTVLSWSKIAFPVSEYMSDRRSPFTLLDVKRNDLPSPSEAWNADQ
jgi:hypothetical protein